MYKYELHCQSERYSPPRISTQYIPLNNMGFADILSVNLEDTLRLRRAKNKINNINSNLWEDIKKYTNPYELIYIFNNKSNKNPILDFKSIATLRPLSRSFFKMIEIIRDFIPNVHNIDNTLYSLHIAEGPGGFIEATRHIRKSNSNGGSIDGRNDGHNDDNDNGRDSDKAFGITLIDNTRRNVPAWKQSNTFLKQHPEVIISTGSDGTGNIYNIDNILSLESTILTHTNSPMTMMVVENSNAGICKFITADGGFDYSIDYNYQEQASSKLIFCEILTALKYQALGGDFVCKIFDINSYLTVEMLYILYLAYEKIIIYKPLTSRVANSEKYIICNNYLGIQPELLTGLFNVLSEWNGKNTNDTLNQLFSEIPAIFIEKIRNINKEIITIQIQSINNIINIIDTKTNLNKQWKKENIQKQINNAREWCDKYNIPHN
jgi:23S rRNA U2552 (ribose-2'-O)-methylase RlmE/FtsJ